jgi:dihydrofolate synthase/folylpolyglutamate synthase
VNFQDTLEYMLTHLPMYQRVGNTAFKKDLSNIIKLLQGLGNPHTRFKSIHIAGTNGKGSSAHMLASILQSAGYRTGLYTSPHLKQFTERIKVDGKEADKQFVCSFIEHMKPGIEELEPSFFEITVAMAFEYFARESVDIAVVEVGLGGRLDSTNVLMPEISLITCISYDHMEMLGDTLSKIAFEKAGIIKPCVPVVVSETQEEVAAVFRERSFKTGSELYFADQEYVISGSSVAMDYMKFDVWKDGRKWTLSTDLCNSYQLKNLPGVLMVSELLNRNGFDISDAQIEQGLLSVKATTGLKGRWQKLSEKPLIYSDTAHNEAGVKLLFEEIKHIKHKKLFVVWGAVQGKPMERIFRYFPGDASYFFCEPEVPRAERAETLAKIADHFGLHRETVIDVNEAIGLARAQASDEDLILIGGSNFVVAEISDL